MNDHLTDAEWAEKVRRGLEWQHATYPQGFPRPSATRTSGYKRATNSIRRWLRTRCGLA
jgi:hypothetical protein